VANNFQRKGALSNSHAGREFEEAAHLFWKETGIALERNFSVSIGYSDKRPHKFDLGSAQPPILVECKSFTWTETGNSPSAKIRGMNEVMLLFSVTPPEYRKILFVLKHVHATRGISLAKHYMDTQGHLIAPNVEVWEFDVLSKKGERLR
jgi:hypothetical protein